MNILAFNSSHRGRNGHSHFLIEKIFQGARKHGVECEEVMLRDYNIKPCLACGMCHTKQHWLKCIQTDDLEKIYQKFQKADIIIFSSPAYVFGISSRLKMLLERLLYSTADVHNIQMSKSGLFFHHIDHSVFSKPFVLLVCCDNLEEETPKNVISYFKTYSRFMDAPMLGALVRKSGELSGYGKKPSAYQNYPVLEKIYQAYETIGEEIALTKSISKRTQKLANKPLITVPFFNLLKRIPQFRQKFLEKAREVQQKTSQ